MRQAVTALWMRSWLFKYSSLFLGVFFAVYSPFLLSGRTFIWVIDGYRHHIPFVMETGRLWGAMLSGQEFQFSNYFGLGNCSVTALAFYFWYPLNVLMVVLPDSIIEISHFLSVALHFYLAGLFCFIMLRRFKFNPCAAMTGALMYAFSPIMLSAFTRHYFFAAGAVMLPLLVIATERFLENHRKWGLLVSVVVIHAFMGYYFFFFNSVFIALYVLFRMRELYKGENWAAYTLRLGKFAAAYLTGIILSSVVLLPFAYMIIDSSRGAGAEGILFFSVQSIALGIVGLFLPTPSLDVFSPPFANILLLAFLPFFFLRKGNITMKIMLVFCVSGLALPFVGYLMNGFVYVNNRWNYMVALVGIYVIVYGLENQKQFFKRKINTKKVGAVGLVLCIAFGFSFNLIYSREFLRWGDYAQINYARYRNFSHTTSDGSFDFFRVTQPVRYNAVRPNVRRPNLGTEGLIDGYFATNAYVSSMHAGKFDFARFFHAHHNFYNVSYNGFDNRGHILAILNNRYMLLQNEQTFLAPYGYIHDGSRGNRHTQVYTNSNALPFGFVYRSFVTREQAAALNPIARESLLTKAVVLEQDVALGRFDVNRIDNVTMLTAGEGLSIEWACEREFNLTFPRESDSEVFVQLYIRNKTHRGAFVANLKSESGYVNQIQSFADINLFNDWNNFFVVNMGYLAEWQDDYSVSVSLTDGDFVIADIAVYLRDMGGFAEEIAAVNARESLMLYSYDAGRIRGSITMREPGIVFFSVPYSRGFNAHVNGEPADILQANIGFMGLLLDEGDFEIEIWFRTPFLRLGGIVTLVGGLGVVLFWVFGKFALKRLGKEQNAAVMEE